MAVRSWTLTDVSQDVHLDALHLGADQLRGPLEGCSVVKRTLRGGLRDGVDVVEVDNGAFRFTALPTRGMSLWRASGAGVHLGWKSPVQGPVHPKFVPVWEPSGIGFLSGFDEFLVRCGLESNGAPEFDEQGRVKYPLHGKIGNLPAHRVELSIDDSTGEITLVGEVDESRLFGAQLRLRTTYRTWAGGGKLQIVDEITQLGAGMGEAQLLYHINIGEPFLTPGARLSAPIRKLVPRTDAAVKGLREWQEYAPMELNAPEQVFFTQLAADHHGRTAVLLRNAENTAGVGLKFSVKELPYFIVWKNGRPSADGYVTGLEPAVNFPNPRSFEAQHGRLLRLSSGQTYRSALDLEIHSGGASLEAAESEIAALASTVTPEIHPTPTADWVS